VARPLRVEYPGAYYHAVNRDLKIHTGKSLQALSLEVWVLAYISAGKYETEKSVTDHG
jgi:hypothetical protein